MIFFTLYSSCNSNILSNPFLYSKIVIIKMALRATLPRIFPSLHQITLLLIKDHISSNYHARKNNMIVAAKQGKTQLKEVKALKHRHRKILILNRYLNKIQISITLNHQQLQNFLH